MSVLEPLGPDEQFAQLTEAVRQHNSAEIKELLAQLKPYAFGYAGPINPGHVRVYLEALKQLGQLWRVFDRPVVKDEGVDEQARVEVEAAERQRIVLAELSELRKIADRRRG